MPSRSDRSTTRPRGRAIGAAVPRPASPGAWAPRPFRPYPQDTYREIIRDHRAAEAAGYAQRLTANVESRATGPYRSDRMPFDVATADACPEMVETTQSRPRSAAATVQERPRDPSDGSAAVKRVRNFDDVPVDLCTSEALDELQGLKTERLTEWSPDELDGVLVDPETGEIATARELEMPDPEIHWQGPVRSCDPEWVTVSCGCGFRKVHAGGCMAEDCVRCGPMYDSQGSFITTGETGERRVKTWFPRFEAELRTRPCLYTVFTLPPEIRSTVTRSTWQTFRRKLIRCLKDHFGFEWGVESTHPIGNDNKEFHPHMNVLWFQLPGWRPYLDLADLKRRWAEIIGVDVSRINLRHRYESAPAKVRHWLAYTFRPFPGWSHWTGKRVRPYWRKGRLPPKIPTEPKRCPKCGELMLCWGTTDPPAWAESEP